MASIITIANAIGGIVAIFLTGLMIRVTWPLVNIVLFQWTWASPYYRYSMILLMVLMYFFGGFFWAWNVMIKPRLPQGIQQSINQPIQIQ